MKALSLYQPYATAVAIGAKRFETRPFPTKYRGPLLICSTASAPAKVFRAGCQALGYGWAPKLPTTIGWMRENAGLPHGAALCVVEGSPASLEPLARGARCEAARRVVAQQQLRLAWRLENVRVLHEPVPVSPACATGSAS